MNILDIILLIILAWFLYKGAKVGFIKLIGGFIGIILGAWAAGRFYDIVAEQLLSYFDIQVMLAIVASFIGIFIAVNMIVGIIVTVIMSVFKIIPFATFTNRIIGAALGLLQGLLLVGLIIWVITLFPFENSFSRSLDESEVAKYFEYSTQLVQPLLPDSLREIDFTFLQDLQNFSDEKSDYIKENMPRFFDTIKERSLDLKERVDEEIKLNDELQL